jgi:DNA-binding beta-propeller fold protein YncE
MSHLVRTWRASRSIRLLVLMMLLGAAAQVFLSQGRGPIQDQARRPNSIGRERLVSIEPLPAIGGEMCPPEESPISLLASANPPRNITAVMRQQSGSGAGTPAAAPARPSEAAKAAVAARKPAATLKDPRNAFSGLVVDPIRNEVVIAEENNFSILVYDRMMNTPANAAFSEPKRVINGEETHIEYACGVYVDPVTGDIYGINNDTLNWMTVFDRNAKGNARPNRKLATPYSTFGIVADEETQELLMTIQEDNAVIAFKKAAKDQDAPVRLLQGAKTQLADPHGIALDPKTGLIYVTNWGIIYERRYDEPPPRSESERGPRKPNWSARNGTNVPGSGKILEPSITVYRKDAHGDIAPVRVIQGAKTQMNWPTSIAVHPDRGEIFVANDTGDSITVYRTDANGDAAPIRVIKGPRSMVKNPTGVALDLMNNELWVANFGNHSATVYAADAAGDTAPKRVIRSAPANEPSPMLSNPHTLAFDTKRDNLLVSN